jgi:hypothetical protein
MSLATSSSAHGKTSPRQNWSSQQQHQYRQLQPQQQALDTASNSATAGRRMLPSPVLKQVSQIGLALEDLVPPLIWFFQFYWFSIELCSCQQMLRTIQWKDRPLAGIAS